MDIYREQIDRIVYEQKNLLEKYTGEYESITENLAAGHLISGRNNGRDNYYHAYNENGKYMRKCINTDADMISTLARKEYLRIAVDALRKNIRILESSYEELEDTDFDVIRSQMHKVYKGLPEESFFTNGAGWPDKLSEDNEDRFRRHREWANEPYEKSSYKPEGLRFMTSAGFRVRSKSEQHIVEQLENYGVPYRYEQVIRVSERSYSADYTFRDRNGELFYWEHAGMMDIPDYMNRHYRKMDVFGRIGIVPWKNLIVTYDIDGVINVPMIKSVIEYDVIPRL